MDFVNFDKFLRENQILINSNPCVSPNFCLNWNSFQNAFSQFKELIKVYEVSKFDTESGSWKLIENTENGDCAWLLEPNYARDKSMEHELKNGIAVLNGCFAYPCTWENLISIKNLVLQYDPNSTIFPTACGSLSQSSLGIGARWTTLHWSAVDWTMTNLNMSLTANQNSVPRELVYDVNEMLMDRLDTVPFKFIGASVPEGHQGQSIEGMSHGAVLAKLMNGFHLNRIQWGFNADHQPIGGKFDKREDALVQGSLLATYITYDISHSLSSVEDQQGVVPPEDALKISSRVKECGIDISEEEQAQLMKLLWIPICEKMVARDKKYAAIRAKHFTTPEGRAYFRELSIDELPGLSSPALIATALAMCEFANMKIQYIAPAFGFKKNFPFEDNSELKLRISAAWKVCQSFGTSIGFHSGSGKSAENYTICGDITRGNLEIKTSGRYTYEMGKALMQSNNQDDIALWNDWYEFTRTIALDSAFSEDEDEKQAAREFIVHTLKHENTSEDAIHTALLSPKDLRTCLESLTPNPDHMIWFEYNFLFVLAKDGAPIKSGLGDHSKHGYAQRARFYSISETAKFNYSKLAARYIIFLARTTGLASNRICAQAESRLDSYTSLKEFCADISPANVMRAISLSHPGRFVSIHKPKPLLEPSHALVRVQRVGVCGTDYHAHAGNQPFFSYPRIVGHELGVEIVELDDSKTTKLHVGDRCAVRPYISCNTCAACKVKKENCCEKITVLGVHQNGGFQEYLNVPLEYLHPSTLSYDHLALIEPLSIGCHAVARSKISKKDRVLVLGAGPIGMAVAQFCVAEEPHSLIMADIQNAASRLKVFENIVKESPKVATKFNTLTISPNGKSSSEVSIIEALRSFDPEAALPSLVFDATGNKISMNSSFEKVEHGGTVVFVGLHLGDVTFNDANFHKRELQLLASRNATADDFDRVIKYIECGKVNISRWITHTATLSEMIEEFPKWSDPSCGVLKAVVSMT